jgi:hypothetical protein
MNMTFRVIIVHTLSAYPTMANHRRSLPRRIPAAINALSNFGKRKNMLQLRPVPKCRQSRIDYPGEFVILRSSSKVNTGVRLTLRSEK